MVSSELIFLDAGLFIGALMGADRRHPEARPLVEAARRGEWMACTSVGVLAEVWHLLALPLRSSYHCTKAKDDAIIAAYATGEFSYQQIADFFGLHFTTVGKIIRVVRKESGEDMLRY